MMLPQKKRAPEGARLYSYDRRLEAVNHAHEEDADVGTRRRRHVLAALALDKPLHVKRADSSFLIAA